MICYRKFFFSMKMIKGASSLKLRVKLFPKFFPNRAFCSLVGDLSYFDSSRWFTTGEVEAMPRRELQRWCKKLGIRANTKTVQMRADLLDFHQNILSNSDVLRYPFLPMKNAQVNIKMSNTRPEKLLCNNNWNVSTDPGLGQVRHFKNTPSSANVNLYEDAVLYHEGMKSSSILSGKLPSVSKILRSTAPKSKLFAISHWTKKQKEILGEDIFQHKMNEIKKKGSEFHNFVHRCLVGEQPHSDIPESLQGYLESTRELFDKLSNVIASEKSVHHSYLGYQGKLDMIACYDGNPCIIEWKTSQRQKASLADCGEYPLQMVAYAGAVNGDHTIGVQLRHGLLVIAYEDGSPADVHFLDLKQCRNFWQDWLVRLYQFRKH